MVDGLWWAGLLVAGLIALAEASFRIGLRMRPHCDDRLRSQTTTVQASTLGLFGLLLAFAMSMAEGRFTARRELGVDEANAIGTAYLRSRILPDAQGEETRALMRDYVASRRAFHDAGTDEARIAAATAASEQLQRTIWAIGIAATRDHPQLGDPMSLYLEGLNDMIDLESKRDAFLDARTPRTIHVLVLLVALIAIAATGYSCGLDGRRTLLADVLMPALIALACLLVADLDRPRAGMIRFGDGPMQRLQHQMEER